MGEEGAVPWFLPTSSPPLGWSPGERGPAAPLEEGATVTRCGCARACGARGDPVCGSDGVVYASACLLQEAACRGRERLEPAPPGRCAPGEDPPAPALGIQSSPPGRFTPSSPSHSILSITLSSLHHLCPASPLRSSALPCTLLSFPLVSAWLSRPCFCGG